MGGDACQHNAPLGAVVVDLQIAILAVVVQRRPVFQRVPNRPTFRTLRQHLCLDLQQVPMQLVQNGRDFRAKELPFGTAIARSLYPIPNFFILYNSAL